MSAIIPCLFGTTKGFEMLELAPLPFKVKDLLVAITQGEVELALEDSCVKILRIKTDNKVHTWIGLYRKAYEMGFSREGGYYGAGVWLSDTTVNARQIMDALEDLCQQIRRLALEDRKFQRTLSDIEPRLEASPAVNALLKGVPPLSKGGISADAKKCAFIAQPQAAHDIINWAQTDALAHDFQSVIIAPASAFPKAGASASITRYADIPALEQALERDHTARLAKLDALAKDWQRNAQSLEAEARARNFELQTLKLKNSQLESEATRARLLVKQDGRGRALNDDDSFLSTDVAKLLLTVLAIVSILGNLALLWFWYTAHTQNGDYVDQIAELQFKYNDAGNNLRNAYDELAETKMRLERTSNQLAEAETEINKFRSENSVSILELDGVDLMSALPEGQSGTPAPADAEAPADVDNSPQLSTDDSASSSLARMAESAVNGLEKAILKRLEKGSATEEELSQYVDDKHLVFYDKPAELANALDALEKSDHVGKKTDKYFITENGKRRLKGSVPQ